MGKRAVTCLRYVRIECKVYMVKVSYNQKPYRRIMMETWGANVFLAQVWTLKVDVMLWLKTPIIMEVWD